MIHYTTDGSDPTEEDQTITSGSSVSIAQDTTLKAIAFKPGLSPSAINTASYRIALPLSGVNLVADPVSPKPAGTPVTLTATAENGAVVKYKFDLSTDHTIWTALQDFSTSNSFIWTPTSAGDYFLRVSAREGDEVTPVFSDEEAYTVNWYSVTGTLQFLDYLADPTEVLITVELCKQNGPTTTKTIYLSDENGHFELTNVEPGTYDFGFKASHWLRKVVHNVAVPQP